MPLFCKNCTCVTRPILKTWALTFSNYQNLSIVLSYVQMLLALRHTDITRAHGSKIRGANHLETAGSKGRHGLFLGGDLAHAVLYHCLISETLIIIMDMR